MVGRVVSFVIFSAGATVTCLGIAINLLSWFLGWWPELTTLVFGPALMILGGFLFLLSEAIRHSRRAGTAGRGTGPAHLPIRATDEAKVGLPSAARLTDPPPSP
jgi:hypothetical protein